LALVAGAAALTLSRLQAGNRCAAQGSALESEPAHATLFAQHVLLQT
jgi:hypothetical protein